MTRFKFFNLTLGSIFAALMFVSLTAALAAPRSKTIATVLREPLPPEELQFSRRADEFVITGPTFAYRVSKRTGAITGLRVVRDGKPVITQSAPAEILVDDYRLSSKANKCEVTVLESSKGKIVLEAKGQLRGANENAPSLSFSVRHTFFNDGVVVSDVKLTPTADLPVKNTIVYQLSANGEFSNYLHKRRDEHGQEAARGRLPTSSQAIKFTTLTSCLSVYSPTAALAIFTDGGGIFASNQKLDTAYINVDQPTSGLTPVTLKQYLVQVAPGEQPFVLKGGQDFTFRTGISVAPNRLPHPRTQDLRMFIWIGDAKFPYPTDDEITQVAHCGFTVFQLHRIGTPGEPRPPAGEFERVLRKVHELGMLFVWEENADLLYDSAPGVQAMKAKGQWPLWQGFNYGGRYTATMDPYCDLIATCLASPNGMTEYRLANINRMMERYPVDGIYLDDNLGYENCTLWKEHGHPRQTYDCLIELHEMNWRRREVMREKIPHLVLISHNTKAFVLPILADFDVQYFAEGYCFNSAQDYWENYRAWSLAANAQAMICPGDDEGVRCNAALIGNYDFLTGGGQYNQMDWRLFPNKFHYAGGVSSNEIVYAKEYGLAQSYFGLYESTPFYFANSTNLFHTTAPATHASVYHNKLWNEWLIPVANMSATNQTTAFQVASEHELGLSNRKEYRIFNVLHRDTKAVRGSELNDSLGHISVPGQNLELFTLRESTKHPSHVWGGKRISEQWDGVRKRLMFEISGPADLKDTIFIHTGKQRISRIAINGKPADFSFDSAQGLAHGNVTFTTLPLKIEVQCEQGHSLPAKPVSPNVLVQQRTQSRKK